MKRQKLASRGWAQIVERMKIKLKKESKTEKLVEGVDYYFENDFMVFTENFHLKRGYCCSNGCRHCPFQNQSKNVANSSCL